MCIPSMHTTRAHVIVHRQVAKGMAATVTCSCAMAVRMAATVRSASGVSATRRGRLVCAVRVNAPSHACFVCSGVRLCSMRYIIPRLQTCVGTLKDGYIRKVPLPRVPRIQSASHMQHMHDTCYFTQVPRIPTWSDLTRSLAGLGRSVLRPFSLSLV